jgi:hypothetical protein
MAIERDPVETQNLPALIQALREAGDDPTPALLEAILAHGQAAVAPLREFLETGLPQGVAGAHDRSIPRPAQEAMVWAAGLLSQFGEAEAVPLLLRVAPRCPPLVTEIPNLMGRLGGPARPYLHAYLRGEIGAVDTEVREQVVRALGRMGYDPDTAALLIERADQCLNAPRYNQELAETYGYALLAMRAPEARGVLDGLEFSDPKEWFPETEESIELTLARGPAPAEHVPDIVTRLKQRRAWRALQPEARSAAAGYEPLPEPDPEEQARKRAARQARRATKTPGKAQRRR